MGQTVAYGLPDRKIFHMTMHAGARPEVFVVRANDMAFMGLLRSVAQTQSIAVPIVYTWPGAPEWLSQKSRHFINAQTIPNPVTDEEGAVEALMRLGQESFNRTGRKPLVLPSSDTVLMLFLTHEDRFKMIFDLMGDREYSSYRAEITHKGSFFEILERQCPQICPLTLRCSEPNDIEKVVRQATFPCIVKPAVKDYSQSFYKMHDGAKAITVNGREELAPMLKNLIAKGFDLVVQEKIIFDSGRDEVPFYAFVDHQGQIRLAATGVKEFLQPAPFGTATVLRLSWHENLLSLAQQVADAIQWRGTLMIEFINDQKDGCWKVVEVNTRPWLFQDFYRRCGIPFVPWAIDDHATAEKSELGLPIVPARSLLETKDPIHIDLPTITNELLGTEKAQSLEPAQRVELLSEFISSFSANFTSAHGSAHDIKPLHHMLDNLATTYDLPKDELVNTFSKGLTELPGTHRLPE